MKYEQLCLLIVSHIITAFISYGFGYEKGFSHMEYLLESYKQMIDDAINYIDKLNKRLRG